MMVTKKKVKAKPKKGRKAADVLSMAENSFPNDVAKVVGHLGLEVCHVCGHVRPAVEREMVVTTAREYGVNRLRRMVMVCEHCMEEHDGGTVEFNDMAKAWTLMQEAAQVLRAAGYRPDLVEALMREVSDDV